VFGGAKKVKSKTTYGLTAWQAPNGKVEVFVTQENTTNLAKVVLTDAGNGKVGYQKTATLSLPNSFTLPGGGSWKPCFNPKHPDWEAHVEGMVVDPATGTLWADQEIVGLWRITTDLTNPTLVHKLARFGQTYSTASGKCKINTGSTSYGDAYLPGDLEGIGLYQSGPNDGYLIISNQMASTYAVFARDGGQHVGDFKIVDSAATDKTDATDGLDAISVDMGPQFPQGLLVIQDGKDASAGGTNFKFVPWQRVASAFSPPL
jgi:3-phytase